MTPIQQNFDCNSDVDDTAVFFSRDIGGSRIVIIPKDTFTLSETDTTFVLTLKQN